MSLLAIGANHKTAPIHIRERLSFSGASLEQALHAFRQDLSVPEATLLSTCNRTEFYCSNVKVDDVLEWWRDYHQLSLAALRPYVYIHEEQFAVKHMMRVASGLDSLVIGEPQILGQLKTAYATAEHIGGVGRELSRLFQHTFSVAKQIRTQTKIAKAPVSVAYAAVCLAKQIFEDFSKASVLLIGAGENSQLTAEHLVSSGIQEITVVNRNLERAQLLADRFGAKTATFAELPDALIKADIVISSTAAMHTVVSYEVVKQAVSKRRYRPMLMIDLAVPRDIDSKVSKIEEVFLYSVDDLENIVQRNRDMRESEVKAAEAIIEKESKHFMRWYQSRSALSMVGEYRQQMEREKDKALALANQSIRQGKSPEEVIQILAHDLTNRWLHHPTITLKKAILEGDSETLELFKKILETE